MATNEGEPLPEKARVSDKNLHEVSSDAGKVSPEINERALLRKLDGNLLPAVGLLYLLSFLDRSNGLISLIRLSVVIILT